MADIFISYATEDRDRIRPLAMALVNEGWAVFWDRTIKPGQTWQKVIGKELHEARCVVVAWSAASVESEWVLEEAGEGKKRGVLIPLSLDSVKVPFGFGQIQCADLTDWRADRENQGFRDLVDAIADKIGRPLPRDAEPPSPSTAPAEGTLTAEFVSVSSVAVEEPVCADPLEGNAQTGPAAQSTLPPREPRRPQDPGSHASRRVRGWLGALLAVVSGVFLVQRVFEVTTPSAAPPKPADPVTPKLAMVRLPNSKVAIGQYEVTQGQWRAVMGSNPSLFQSCGDDCPVESVSFDDIQDFLKKLNQRTGQRFRLPTEEEWFAACQAGEQHEYCGSDSPDEVAWYGDWSRGSTHPVGRKRANAWGFYDMSGNVNEWTSSCYENDCGRRVLRGGSWSYVPVDLRSAARNWNNPANRNNDLGFRLAQDF